MSSDLREPNCGTVNCLERDFCCGPNAINDFTCKSFATDATCFQIHPEVKDLPLGAIVGLVIGSLTIFAVCIAACFWCCKGWDNAEEHHHSMNYATTTTIESSMSPSYYSKQHPTNHFVTHNYHQHHHPNKPTFTTTK